MHGSTCAFWANSLANLTHFSLEAPPDVGEVNNSGDIVETCLTLARATGEPALYQVQRGVHPRP
jgi:hypothetical protein